MPSLLETLVMWPARVVRILRAAHRRSMLDADAFAEFRLHVELEAEDLERKGVPRAEATRRARLSFGSLEAHRMDAHDARGTRTVEILADDLRYGWRQLAARPGQFLIIVVVLGLGIGANAAILSFLDRVLLSEPSGVVAADNVHRLYALHPRATGDMRLQPTWSYPEFVAIRRALPPETMIGADVWNKRLDVDAPLGSVEVRADYVTAGFLQTLLGRAAIGRFIGDADDSVRAPHPVAVIGFSLWRRAFDSDSNIVGRSIRVGRSQVAVIGVAPEGFDGIDLDPTAIWLPASVAPMAAPGSTPWYLDGARWPMSIVLRTSSAAGLTTLLAQSTSAYRSTDPDTTAAEADRSVVAGSLIAGRGPWFMRSQLNTSTRLAAVAFLLLLLACANVGILLLLRGTRRQHEIAVRLALGASRARVISQLLIESLLLTTIAGAVGLLVAGWTGGVLRVLIAPSIHWIGPILDWRITAFAFGAALTCGLVCGLLPAFDVTTPDLAAVLKGGRRVSDRLSRSRLRGSLVAVQVALSFLLLWAAGLFVRSLERLENVDLGFDRNAVVIAAPNASSVAGGRAVLASDLTEASRRLTGASGIQAVALATGAPFVSAIQARIRIPGTDSNATDRDPPSFLAISPEYFGVMGIRVIRGRGVESADTQGSERVAVVNESMAERFWPGRSALGQCVAISQESHTCYDVVGVVEDTRQMRIIEPPKPEYYVPLTQAPWKLVPTVLIARAKSGELTLVANTVTSIMEDELPAQGRTDVFLLSTRIAPQLRGWKLAAALFSALGFLAFFIAGVGVYSAMAYSFSVRNREIAIRIAMGSRAGQIVRLLVFDTLRIVGWGLLLGGVVGLSLARFATSAVYGITPRDPIVLVATASMLVCAAVGAVIIPARRSSRVSVRTALANE